MTDFDIISTNPDTENTIFRQYSEICWLTNASVSHMVAHELNYLIDQPSQAANDMIDIIFEQLARDLQWGNDMQGEFYLHENGKVIYKAHMGSIDTDSPFVIRKWSAMVVGESSSTFLAWLTELNTLGADREEIYRLATHNNLADWHPNWETVVLG